MFHLLEYYICGRQNFPFPTPHTSHAFYDTDAGARSHLASLVVTLPGKCILLLIHASCSVMVSYKKNESKFKSPNLKPLSITLKRSLIRLLSSRRQPRQMASLPIRPVKNCSVRSHTVVPDDHRVLLPLQAGLKVRAESNVLV